MNGLQQGVISISIAANGAVALQCVTGGEGGDGTFCEDFFAANPAANEHANISCDEESDTLSLNTCDEGWLDLDGQLENGCETFRDDMDGDGWTPWGGDCRDYNPDVNPGAGEVRFNGIDDDCDGLIDPPVLSVMARNNMNCPAGDTACTSRGSGTVLIRGGVEALFDEDGNLLFEYVQSCVYSPGEFTCSKDAHGAMTVTIVSNPGFYFAWDFPEMNEPGVCTAWPTGLVCVITIGSDLVVRGAFLPFP